MISITAPPANPVARSTTARFKSPALIYAALSVLIATSGLPAQDQVDVKRIRFATYNVSLNRRSAGRLIEDLKSGRNKQARQVAEVIQRVRPDVILLNEFDYDADGQAVNLFRKTYLSVGQSDCQPLDFPYCYAGPVNTGVPSGVDLNANGKTADPADAFGFGHFPGQYGMLLLSMYPIESNRIRTFQKFLWKDMPDSLLPIDPGSGRAYYKQKVLEVFRLSSKSHWDIPILVNERRIHLLASHPTPPVFDGPEDRNGCRNHDEIRLFADYVDPQKNQYLYDDQGLTGGLQTGERFVIAGDQNADPHDGDSRADAIHQLTKHRLINGDVIPTSAGGAESSTRQGRANQRHRGNPAHDTADFNDTSVGNLRIDYLLPSRSLVVRQSGIFWPRQDEAGAELVAATDHRLVWIDVEQ